MSGRGETPGPVGGADLPPGTRDVDRAALLGTALAAVVALSFSGQGQWDWLGAAAGIALLVVLGAFFRLPPSRQGPTPGLWGELSYRSDVADGAGRLSAEWKAMFTRHPKRFLLGSDTWVNERWESYPQLMAASRRWLGDLPPATAERVAWRNGAELFGLP